MNLWESVVIEAIRAFAGAIALPVAHRIAYAWTFFATRDEPIWRERWEERRSRLERIHTTKSSTSDRLAAAVYVFMATAASVPGDLASGWKRRRNARTERRQATSSAWDSANKYASRWVASEEGRMMLLGIGLVMFVASVTAVLGTVVASLLSIVVVPVVIIAVARTGLAIADRVVALLIERGR